jgi:hypothetical protein
MATQGDYRARFAAAYQRSVNEEEEAFIDGLRMDFINKCSVNNAFKIDNKDLQSTEFKSEIRFLICRKYFPDLQTSDIFLSKITTAKALNQSLDIIQALDAKALKELLQLNAGSGLGPGEALLYFLLDNATIGGGSSAGVDVIDNGTKYELKAVKLRKKDMMLNEFKLGGTVDISDIQSRIMRLKKAMLEELPNVKEGEKTGINDQHLKAFKNKKIKQLIEDRDDLTSWEELEKEFQELAYDEYFNAHPIIFMGSQGSNSKEMGRVFAIVQVQKKDIRIHQVTSSTIKPGVLIKKLEI